MKATEKERICIDYSLHYREKVIIRNLAKLNEDKVPVILKPNDFVKHFWQDYSITMKMLPIWKKTILFLVVTIFYVIIFTIIFFCGMFQKLTGERNIKKNQNELNITHLIDYNVSNIKTFSQLWNDKGLRDWGVTHTHLTGFTEEEQLDCIIKWFSILYERNKKEIDDLSEKIQQNIHKSVADFYETNPRGHISTINVVQALPDEIDMKYGSYE